MLQLAVRLDDGAEIGHVLRADMLMPVSFGPRPGREPRPLLRPTWQAFERLSGGHLYISLIFVTPHWHRRPRAGDS